MTELQWYDKIDISDVWTETYSPSHPNDVLKYTKLEAVSRKLNGKLKLFYHDSVDSTTVDVNWTNEPEPLIANYNEYLDFQEEAPGTEEIPTVSDDVISIELFVETALQKEEYLDLILGQIYMMPLKKRHRVLEDVCNNLVIAELLNINYNVLNENTELEQRAANYANNLINLLTAGYDIQLPYTANTNVYSNRTGSYPNRLHLPSEKLKIEPPKTKVTNFDFTIDRWEDTTNSYDDFFIDNK